MKNFLFPFLKCLLPLIILFSCEKAENTMIEGDANLGEPQSEIVSVDEAIQSLNMFLSETQMIKTKADENRTYSSIIPHFTEKGVPDAYLVNFDNNEGFAILGAKEGIAPIIAVVENGNTDWDKLLPQSIGGTAKSFFDEDEEDLGLGADVLGPGIPPEQILTMCVRGALFGVNDDEDEDEDEIGTKAGQYTTNISPLLGSDYNYNQITTYCHKNNHRFVTNGCAATAIAMICAYKHYPELYVDHVPIKYYFIDYDSYHYTDFYKYIFPDCTSIYIKTSDYFTNSQSIPSELNDAQRKALIKKIDSKVIKQHGDPFVIKEPSFKRYRYKLLSGIYYTLSNAITGWDATGTMPSAALDGLVDLGYDNVTKTSKTSLTSAQITRIKNMLNHNKPVLICGWSLFNLSDSHYWVIDGFRQNGSNKHVHCNWGWGGDNNGWFATDCLRPESQVPAKSFDNKSSGTGNAWNHIVVYTYDIKHSVPYKWINDFYNHHRATY